MSMNSLAGQRHRVPWHSGSWVQIPGNHSVCIPIFSGRNVKGVRVMRQNMLPATTMRFTECYKAMQFKFEGVSSVEKFLKSTRNQPARILILICDPWDIFTSLCKVRHFPHYLLTVYRPKLLHWCMTLKFIKVCFKKWISHHNTPKCMSTPWKVLRVHFIEVEMCPFVAQWSKDVLWTTISNRSFWLLLLLISDFKNFLIPLIYKIW